MKMSLELIPLPVSDVDRAIAFYADKLNFKKDHDVRPSEGVRVVQLTPEGSSCSIGFVGLGWMSTRPSPAALEACTWSWTTSTRREPRSWREVSKSARSTTSAGASKGPISPIRTATPSSYRSWHDARARRTRDPWNFVARVGELISVDPAISAEERMMSLRARADDAATMSGSCATRPPTQ